MRDSRNLSSEGYRPDVPITKVMRLWSVAGPYLLSLVCIVGAACGGSGGPSNPSPQPMPTPPPPPPINGAFGGGGSATSSLGTDARTSVSIEITNTVITNLSMPWRTGGPAGTSQATFCAGSASIANLNLTSDANSFARDIDSAQYLTHVEGTVSGDSMRGSLTLTAHPGNVPAYCASATIPWTANKGASPTPLQ
jgi:hypothetical protein